MVILVSNIATDHCHQSVTKGYHKKKRKRPTVLSSAPSFVFASPGITFVSASPPSVFGFAPVFFNYARAFFGVGPANP